MTLQCLQRPIGLDQSGTAFAVWLGSEAPIGKALLFAPQEPIKFGFEVAQFAPDCGFCHDHRSLHHAIRWTYLYAVGLEMPQIRASSDRFMDPLAYAG